MLKLALAQIAPVLVDSEATQVKIIDRITQAAGLDAQIVAFGETILPAYPVWLSRTGGARFDDPQQKALHSRYLEQAVCLEEGGLTAICEAAKEHEIWVVLGIAERPKERAGYTIYCSRVFISDRGEVASVHRKLVPTYEERLSWGHGDGAGLVTHEVSGFTVGGLNCWENWMPLARTSLYAAGEDLHIALWPGAHRLTKDITRFIAMESRSYVASVSGLIRDSDIPRDLPLRDKMCSPRETIYDGGSCVAGPDGEWLVAPVTNEETLLTVDLDPARIREERQNFDPSGHYARPDIFQLAVNRTRQGLVDFLDEDPTRTGCGCDYRE